MVLFELSDLTRLKQVGKEMPETRELRIKLATLQTEHRDLDEVIERLIDTPPFDQLQLQRLKKRKLVLKDQITRLEALIVPDIIA